MGTAPQSADPTAGNLPSKATRIYVAGRRGLVDLLPPIVVRGAKRVMRRAELPVAPVEPVVASYSSPRAGSYSQYGEDLVIDAVLGCPESGFFVDIGANDPVLLSNTKRFSLRGWTGINVEPNPAVFERIVNDRIRDTNLNVGVSSSAVFLTFYSMDPDTLSTFDEPTAQRNIQEYEGARIADAVDVQVVKLSSLLASHVREGTAIDFMSLDVEGCELDVLRSNDWDTYRPRCVMVEINRSGRQIVEFLSDVGYEGVWCNGTNALFIDSLATIPWPNDPERLGVER